jgi:hypothetical protein
VLKYIRKPFKGSVAYEWQIGSLVFQWVYGFKSYTDIIPKRFVWTPPNPIDGGWRLQIHKFLIWNDPYAYGFRPKERR